MIREEQVLIEKLRLAFEAANEGIWEMKQNGLHDFYTPKFYEKFPIDLHNCTLEDWIAIVHPEDQHLFTENVEAHLGQGLEGFRSEYRVRKNDDTYCWLEDFGIAKYSEEGAFQYMIGSHVDITSRKENEAKIVTLAYFDELTGLYNRPKFLELLKEETQLNKKGQVLLIDIVNFKFINDAYGILVGDQILIKIGRIMDSFFEREDVARITGDEFAVLLRERKSNEAIKSLSASLAHEINQAIKDINDQLHLQIRMAITKYPEDGYLPDILLQNLTLAISSCKELTGQICFFSKQMKEEQLRKLLLSNLSKGALAREELRLVYQPIFEQESKKVIIFEALLRWESKEFGSLYPDEFIPVMEENQSINEIGLWVLQEAARFGKEYKEQHQEDIRVSVNVSPRQLLRSAFADQARRCIEDIGANSRDLIIEITESATLQYSDIVLSNLYQLRKDGFHIALDDFGSGYATIKNLLHIPFHTIKIDKHLTWQLTKSIVVSALLQSIVDFAHQLEMAVVFEGVETKEMEEAVHKLGADLLQGYYYSKALEKEKAIVIKRA